jgi:hypothetical protein
MGHLLRKTSPFSMTWYQGYFAASANRQLRRLTQQQLLLYQALTHYTMSLSPGYTSE